MICANIIAILRSFWHLADINPASENVRFRGKADIPSAHFDVCL